jgi:hypothetical protein
MIPSELVEKIALREFVVCAFIRESLNMHIDRFNELFGHLETSDSPSGASRFRTSEVLPILRGL